MACRLFGAKPLSKPMLAHYDVTVMITLTENFFFQFRLLRFVMIWQHVKEGYMYLAYHYG